jgi:hypothetical protein
MGRRAFLCAIASVSLLFLATTSGCGKKTPPLGEVSGVLSLNGKPLEEVQVEFLPDPEKGNMAQPSRAETDKEGRFSLVFSGAIDKLGVPVGWNRVVLQDFKAMNSRENPMEPRFGANFTTAFETPIKLEVKEGKQEFKIELRDYLK